jgi:prepilin-type N-terminal cleavage/methylation domain-containing protein/prepilin-type processing-associated H-X9-DG protein
VDKERRAAFTLIELLVVTSIISILVAVVMPALGLARATGRSIKCMNHLRNLAQAWQLYADENSGYCMPQVWHTPSPATYWWGAYTDPPDYTRGFLYPYLGMGAGKDNVFDCPEQPWGSYVAQGLSNHPTTTYGYNGLYLCPFAIGQNGQPVWAGGWPMMGNLPNTRWRTLDTLDAPTQALVFADTLMEWFGAPKNCCLLDGPQIPGFAGGWSKNDYPTLCFRHRGRAAVAFADTHADTIPRTEAYITWNDGNVGYIGEDNAPHYVPDWQTWW